MPELGPHGNDVSLNKQIFLCDKAGDEVLSYQKSRDELSNLASGSGFNSNW